MKKFLTVVIAGSLALAASAQAQQSDDQHASKKERSKDRETPSEAQQGPNPQAAHPTAKPHTAPRAYPPPSVAPYPYPPRRIPPVSVPLPRPERNTQNATAIQNPTAVPAPVADDEPAPGASAPKVKRHDGGVASGPGETPDVQKIKARHANFHAQPNPQQVPQVGFDENRKISGSEHWQGDKYAAFRNYHPHRHDKDWYHKHYPHIILICGGYYYWDNFYWYPAWGYNPSVSYYVYDGPIYTGTLADPPDQLIADVQDALWSLGYYDGEVDGLLGPSTSQALTNYQAENGLYQTGAIDQPTIESLGLG